MEFDGGPAAQGCAHHCETCGRLRRAVLDALARHEPESLTAAEMEGRAGVPAGALAAHYGTLDSCLVAIYDEVSEELYRGLVEAFAGPGDWHMRFVMAVQATFDRIRLDPGIARLCFGDSSRGHGPIGERRAASRQCVVTFLADAYEEEQGWRLPDLQFEFLYGALLRAAQDEMVAGREPALVAARVRELLALLEPVPA